MSPAEFIEQFKGHIRLPRRYGDYDTTVHLKRGTAAENAAYVGVLNEMTYSTDDKVLHLHDGETVGGVLHLRLV